MKRSDTYRLIEKAIVKQSAFVTDCLTCSQKNNPQVIAARVHAEGQIDAFNACLLALKGDLLSLRIMAGE